MRKTLITLFLALCLTLPALAEVPYLQKVLRPDEMIFSGPSYDEFCVGTVREKGTFTIVEEVEDGEGHLWGRLKSGAGWIDLTHVRSEEVAAWPVSAAFAEDCHISGLTFTVVDPQLDDAEFAVQLAFRTYQPLTDVFIVSVDLAAEADIPPVEVLHHTTELPGDAWFLTDVVFYGDMSCYGLVFTDAAGAPRFFAVTISGRNGMPVLEELPVVPDLTYALPPVPAD